MFQLPAILMVICGVIYAKFYKLNGDYYLNIMEELEVRRSSISKKSSDSDIKELI